MRISSDRTNTCSTTGSSTVYIDRSQNKLMCGFLYLTFDLSILFKNLWKVKKISHV